MTGMKPTPAEIYAQEKAGDWLYDKDGYCPFARHKLELLLRLAHEAGAASVKKTSALTPKQQDAILDVINERIAGGVDDLRDALGMETKEASEMMRILERVRTKLSTGRKEND